MRRLTLSPSIVESYRYWRGLDVDDAKAGERLAELRASVTGSPLRPSMPLALGSAWHLAVETGENDVDLGDSYPEELRRWRFDPGAIELVRRLEPDGLVRELSGEVEIDGVLIRFRVDGICGLDVWEHKTAVRLDLERYELGMQWRCYLLGLEARRVTYCIVRLEREGGVIVLADEPVLYRQTAYPRMREDVRTAVAEVVEWIAHEGLTEYRMREVDDAA